MNQFTYSHSRTCDCIGNSCNDFLFDLFGLYDYVLYFLSLLIFSFFSYIPLLSIFNILYILPLSFLSCIVLFIFLYLFCYILLYLHLFSIFSIFCPCPLLHCYTTVLPSAVNSCFQLLHLYICTFILNLASQKIKIKSSHKFHRASPDLVI